MIACVLLANVQTKQKSFGGLIKMFITDKVAPSIFFVPCQYGEVRQCFGGFESGTGHIQLGSVIGRCEWIGVNRVGG